MVLERFKKKFATSTELETQRDALTVKTQARQSLIEQQRAELPDLVAVDPASVVPASHALAALEGEQNVDLGTLKLIVDAIPAARDREVREAFAASRAKLDKATTRLAGQIEARYSKPLAEIVTLFKELEENERDVADLHQQARELGEVGLLSAEYRARSHHYLVTRAGFDSLLRVKLPNFDGSFAWHRELGSNAL